MLMAHPTFDELPFNARPDLTPYLLHLTKNTKAINKRSALDNLVSILKSGKIVGSKPRGGGFIKGERKATCFMDVPFASLKYVLTPENSDPQRPRYEPYGIVVTKSYAYKKGCRPVLYLSNAETEAMGIPKSDLWRVVRFEVSKKGWISWLHEREWRCPEDFELEPGIRALLVKYSSEAEKLTKLINENPKQFKCVPRSIIPLSVLCQGFLE